MRFRQFFSRSNKGSCRSSSRDGFRRKMDGRRLRFEPLEVRQLLSVDLYGTAGDDTVTIELDQNETHILVTVNGGQPTSYDADVDIIFHGNGGDDTAYLYGSSGNDTLAGYATSTSVELSTGGSYAVDDDFLHVNTYGEGGTDTAYLYDIDGSDDTFTADSGQATFDYATGVSAAAIGFRYAYAYASGDAGDEAVLCGSSGNDNFYGHDTYGVIADAAQSAYYNYAQGFTDVEADVTGTSGGASGGTDTAYLYDIDGSDDTLTADPGQATLDYATGVSAAAIGFRYAYAYASGDAGDEAVLYGSSGNDLFAAHDTYSQLRDTADTDYCNYAQDFSVVTADVTGTSGGASGGTDTAYLYDIDGSDDTFTADPGQATFDYATGVSAAAIGFRYAYAYASGDAGDEAVLCGSSGNDNFYGHDTYGVIADAAQSAYYNYAQGFTDVEADVTGTSGGASGGTDTAYLYDIDGSDDTLTADPGQATLDYATGVSAAAIGFRYAYAYASGDAGDEAVLYGSSGNDLFAAHDTVPFPVILSSQKA